MKDILFNQDLDLDLKRGDLVSGNSDLQHQELLLMNNRGTFKEFPDAGVDAFGYLQDNNYSDLLSAIRYQFVNDGMKVNNISITETGQLNIDATYGNS